MKLSLIAALGRNRVIGHQGRIPWDLPEDMRHFMQRTTGHCVLMGRKTFDLLPEPLPDRRNVVLTHSPIEGVECYATLQEGLLAVANEPDVYVMGGGRIYEQTINIGDSMVLSHVDAEPDGDTFFPPYEHLIGTIYKEVSRKQSEGFDLAEYRRINPLDDLKIIETA